MIKVVENGERICTVTLDGSESSIVFQNDYKYFTVKNESDADVYVSLNRDIVEGADGVMTIGSKESALFAHMKPHVNMFFIKGTGTIQAFASNTPVNPFKSAPTFDGGVTASGNPVQMDGLQGIVPFSITVSGKNLVYYDIEKIQNAHTAGKWDKNVYTISDVVVTFGTDGIIAMSGTAAANIAIALNWNTNNTMVELAAGSYTISGCPKQNGLSLKLVSSDGSEVYTCQEVSTINVRGGKYKFYINVEKNTVLESVNICAQLELGATATDYEPPIVGRELTLTVNGTEYKITPNSNPYAVPNDIRQQDGLNVVSVSDGVLSVTGVRKNLALKRIWDKIDEITTAVIVANGE